MFCFYKHHTRSSMEKTKLGITVSLLAAIMFFSGTISVLITALIVGYVLLKEEDEWLRSSAVKAMIVIVTFGVLRSGVGLIEYVFSFITYVVQWFTYKTINVPLNLDRMLNLVFSFLEDALLILFGLKALTKGTVKVSFIDKLVNKHMK